MRSIAGVARLAERPSLLVVGLLSGTSADGVDAALVRVSIAANRTDVETLASLTVPLPDALRERTLALRRADAAELCRMDVELGGCFARAALDVIESAGLRPSDVDLIGSHGQTVVHLPGEGPSAFGRAGAATLQIGSAALVAERTGLPVVHDFRARDAAAGGEGAPLVPYADWHTLRLETASRLVQNLGGVANVTLVTPDPGRVRAFDTGPANGPLDEAAALVSGGAESFDRDGALAAAGTADTAEVDRLLGASWFRLPPPKTLDRETFGGRLARDLVARRPDLSPSELLATLTEFVARSIVAAYREHLGFGSDSEVADVVLSGGGVHNATLVRRLRELVHPVPVVSSGELGIDPDAREAVAFAVLAAAFVAGRAGNLPAVTGASGPRILGSLVP